MYVIYVQKQGFMLEANIMLFMRRRKEDGASYEFFALVFKAAW